jgi:hypothetical protein
MHFGIMLCVAVDFAQAILHSYNKFDGFAIFKVNSVEPTF